MGDSLNKRANIPLETETKLLVDSARRCCLCAFLRGDWTLKRIQIAHIDHNRARSTYDNLVILCLEHHDEFDSSTSQSKNITIGEVREYKRRLTRVVESWENGPSFFLSNHPLAAAVGQADSEESTFGYITNKRQSFDPFDAVAKATSHDRDAVLYEHLYEYGLVGEIDKESNFSKGVGTIDISDTSNDKHAIVLVGDKHDWDWWVTAFVKESGIWIRRCLILVECQKYEPPVCQLIPGKNFEALVVEKLTATGTGMYRRSQVWHPLTEAVDSNIVDFPVEAHVSGWGLLFQRDIQGTVIQFPEYLYDGAVLEVHFSVHYESDSVYEGEETDLFSLNRRLVLTWDALGKLFVPSETSEISPQDVSLFFDDDERLFLKHNFKEIENLATVGTGAQRAWVKALVNNCQDTGEAKRIINMLE